MGAGGQVTLGPKGMTMRQVSDGWDWMPMEGWGQTGELACRVQEA